MEICKEISFPPFFRKMLMSAFVLRFKATHLEKMRGYPSFSLCDIGFQVQFNAEFTSQVLNFP